MYLKLIARSVFSLEAIYQLRKAPLALTILMSLILGILHLTPHTFAFIGLDPYIRNIEQLWQITPEVQETLVQKLPSDCAIDELQLTCYDVLTVEVNANLFILVNHDDTQLENGLILMADHFVFVAYGNREMFSYHHLEGLNFYDLQNHVLGYNVLINRMAHDLRTVWILPFVFGSYLTGIVSYFGYIIVVSILSMLLKFGHTFFLKYKEVLNILVFSSVPIVLVVIVVGFVMPAFTTLIFNFATPIVGWFVYKKYVIPGLQEMSSNIKEKDLKGVV